MTRKVAIIGTAESWKDAPFDDPEWEIWGLAWRYYDMEKLCTGPRAFTLFEMHLPEFWPDYMPEPDIYAHWLKEPYQKSGAPVTVIMQPSVVGAFPKCLPYPIDDAKALMGGRNYFTSSFSYMLAKAILEGADEIGIWGVDLVVGTEYIQQRPAAEFLLGIAVAQGIKITVAEGSALLRSGFLYGFEDDTPDPAIARMKAKVGTYEEKIKELMSQVYALGGAKREVEEFVTMLEAQHRGLWSKERT